MSTDIAAIMNKIMEDPTEFRLNVRKMLNDIMSNDVWSLNLEKGIFNYCIENATNKKIIKKWTNKAFVLLYVDKFRTIWMNIYDKQTNKMDKHISELLTSAEIKPHEIAFMTHQELKPEKWSELIKAKMEKDKSSTEMDMNNATDEYQCPKCKARKSTFYELQTRSADEPMTRFIQCLNCGKNWRM